MKRVRAVPEKTEVAAPAPVADLSNSAKDAQEYARIAIEAAKAMSMEVVAAMPAPQVQPLWTKLRVRIVRNQQTGDMSELIISRSET